MTLLVNRCTIVDGRWEIVEEPDHGAELAGAEACRRDLWGSPFVVGLAVQVLARLPNKDIYCAGEELRILERDVQIILAHLGPIAAATAFREDYIAHRAYNMLRAARWAMEHGGGASIS